MSTRLVLGSLVGALLIVDASAVGARRLIVVLGDSVSSGYGLDGADSWVDIFRRRLRKSGCAADVINASTPGRTIKEGELALGEIFSKSEPTDVLVELGANDALNGQSDEAIRRDLDSLLERITKNGATPTLISLPIVTGRVKIRNLGSFLEDVAKLFGVATIDILNGISGAPDSVQRDGIHPAAGVQNQMASNVLQLFSSCM